MNVSEMSIAKKFSNQKQSLERKIEKLKNKMLQLEKPINLGCKRSYDAYLEYQNELWSCYDVRDACYDVHAHLGNSLARVLFTSKLLAS